MAWDYAPLLHSYLREMEMLTDEEFGRLCRRLLIHSAGGTPDPPEGREAFYWVRVKETNDRFKLEYERKCRANQENGKKGGRPKKQAADKKPKKPTNQINTCVSEETHSPPDPLSEGERASGQNESFEAFWAIYPKQRGKQTAWKAWSRLNPDNELTKAILSAVEYQKLQEEWQRDGGRYVPMPEKWLREQRWTDQPTLPPAFDGSEADAQWIQDYIERYDAPPGKTGR